MLEGRVRNEEFHLGVFIRKQNSSNIIPNPSSKESPYQNAHSQWMDGIAKDGRVPYQVDQGQGSLYISAEFEAEPFS